MPHRHRAMHRVPTLLFGALALAFAIGANSVSMGAARAANVCGSREIWVNDGDYGSAGGGFYWDPMSQQVWTAARGWHYFSPQPLRPTPAPLWVLQPDYGSESGGYYWDPVSGQVWTSARGWHPYGEFGCGGPVLVTSKVQLLDVRTGAVTTLYDSAERSASASFDGDVVEMYVGGNPTRVNFDGSPAPPRAPRHQCRPAEGGAEFDGRFYPGVNCGFSSPDGRWMTYARDAGTLELPSGYRVPLSDEWLVDLATGATRELQKGLVHCGGCGGKWVTSWAPSSTYVAFVELGGGQRRWLSEVATGVTREIGHGSDFTMEPIWAPGSDTLVYSTGGIGGGVRLEDLRAGTAVNLPLPWPVRFDASGKYLFSPAWADHPEAPGLMTTIFDVQAQKARATISGAPPRRFAMNPNGSQVLSVSPDGTLWTALVEFAPGCQGVKIYHEAGRAPACIFGATEARLSPSGTLVATSRAVGVVGPAYGADFSSSMFVRYDVIIARADDGSTVLVIPGVLNFPESPPWAMWNSTGTHLLFAWPQYIGE